MDIRRASSLARKKACWYYLRVTRTPTSRANPENVPSRYETTHPSDLAFGSPNSFNKLQTSWAERIWEAGARDERMPEWENRRVATMSENQRKYLGLPWLAALQANVQCTLLLAQVTLEWLALESGAGTPTSPGRFYPMCKYVTADESNSALSPLQTSSQAEG